MTILNNLPQKETILNTDNFLISDAQNADTKASAEQLKNYFAPAATETRAGVVTTEAQEFAGDKTLNGSFNVNGEITQNGEPLITDVEISEAEGNALEKKTDGLYVSQAAAGLPIGTVILNPLEILPPGFLRCNGETYLKADYPELYAKLPDIYIIDELSFKVPDYRDRVAQGANGNLNELIAAGLPNITGAFSSIGENRIVDAKGALKQGERTAWRYSGATAHDGYSFELDAAAGETDTNGNLKTDESAKVYGKSNTVQPPAIAQDFIIKATNYSEPEEDVIDDTRTTTGNVWSAAKIKKVLSYSTEETLTGGTWIDGKPIYQITMLFENKQFPFNTWTTVFELPENCNLLFWKESPITAEKYFLGGEGYGAQKLTNNRGIRVYQNYSGGGTDVKSYYITAQYTKTTD